MGKEESLILYLMWLAFGLCMCAVGSARSFDAHTNAEHPPLTDISHRFLDQFGYTDPHWQDPWFHDVYCHSLLILSFVMSVVLCWQHPNIDAKGLLREWCKPHGLLLAMKGILMVVTTVPTPLASCRAAGKVLTSGQLSHYCNDLMFSGHSVLMVMLPFFAQQCPFAPMWARAAWWAMGFGGLVIILGTHQHYTSDVLVAVFMTTALVLPRRDQIKQYWGSV